MTRSIMPRLCYNFGLWLLRCQWDLVASDSQKLHLLSNRMQSCIYCNTKYFRKKKVKERPYPNWAEGHPTSPPWPKWKSIPS